MRHSFTTSPERRVGCMMDGEGWYNSGNSLKTSCAVARVTHEVVLMVRKGEGCGPYEYVTAFEQLWQCRT